MEGMEKEFNLWNDASPGKPQYMWIDSLFEASGIPGSLGTHLHG